MTKINLKELNEKSNKASQFGGEYYLTGFGHPYTREGKEAHAEFISAANPETVKTLIDCLENMRECLDKINDPTKRDHTEPDAYTTIGCLMSMAHDSLNFIKERIE